MRSKPPGPFGRRDDPRVTSIGGILRKLRLDEFPQQLSEKIPYYRQRHAVNRALTAGPRSTTNMGIPSRMPS